MGALCGDSVRASRGDLASPSPFCTASCRPKDGQMQHDDKGIKMWWDVELKGWISPIDHAYVTERMRKVIEAHPEFDGWAAACGCGSVLPVGECGKCSK